MYTEYGYIGSVDGILYAIEAEAKEADQNNPTRAARPPPVFLCLPKEYNKI